jgi:PAS domain S-box-containing protein
MAGFPSPDDIIGKTDYDLCWREFADEWKQLDNKVIQEDTIIEREEQVRLANGELITELTFKTPLKNEHGEVIGVIGTSLDITERKEIEAALRLSQIAAEAADKAKSEFIRNMEHELRTPFSGVYSIVRLLYESEQDAEKKELLELTYQSASEFLNLLNNIIDFSRNQLDSSAVMAKKIDLKNTISRVITMELAAATSKKLTLTMEYPENLPSIFISDPHRIQRLLLNLIGNAIKFTSEGSVSVIVKLAKQVDDKLIIIQLIVSDTGIGIAEEKQKYIYEKFYRLSPANQNKYTGAGLGLYVVRQIINDLEGEIDVISSPNQGTRFICTLPFKRPLIDMLINETQ